MRKDDRGARVYGAVFLEIAVAGEALHDHCAGAAVIVVVLAAFALETGVICIDEADVIAFLEPALCRFTADFDDLTDSFMANGGCFARAHVQLAFDDHLMLELDYDIKILRWKVWVRHTMSE